MQTDGSYEIKRRGTVFNLDAAGCGNTPGTALQLWDDNNQNCQRWTISLESDNHFEIKRKGTALNIDASGCGYTAGTPVHLWTDNNLDCQRWFISPI
ncbi:MAG: RICIN domain-containing protein [Saprospiraceae bacterium]|nr:RICIN domain-containing protein [Saprospiraceae bacterium]